MEYTDYWVVRGDAAKVRTTLAKIADEGVVIDGVGDLVPFVIDGHTEKKLLKSFDWLLRVWDAEGGAWGFDLYVKGKMVTQAIYGENAEWGIDEDDNGFDGDIDESATLLGTTKKKLEKCLDESGVEKFCKAVGFEHHYMLYPRDLPGEVMLLSEMT